MNFICNVTTKRIMNELATIIDASTLDIFSQRLIWNRSENDILPVWTLWWCHFEVIWKRFVYWFSLGGRCILRTDLISIPLGFLLARSYELNISSKDQLSKLLWGIVTIILLDGSSVHTVTNILSDRKQYDEI